MRDGLVRWTQRAFHTIGLGVYRAKPATAHAGFMYERVHPRAAYAPWRSDSDFQATLETIGGHTLIDEYRLFELWSLASRSDLDGDILEVGVWRGGSGAILARAARNATPGARIFLCDTFRGVVKGSSCDSSYHGGEHSTSRASVDTLLARLELDDVNVLEGVFPDETAAALGDVRLRLCHIDVDVYESARDVLHWAWPRLVPGGVVVFDDYGFRECDGITRLVEEEALAPDRVFVHNLNGHGILIKTG